MGRSGRSRSVGDFATDVLGTRGHGVFSEKGTLDPAHTLDGDYARDGRFDGGVGQAINDVVGLDVDPAVVLAAGLAVTTPVGIGGAVLGGLAANEMQDREDLHDITQFGPSDEPSVGGKPAAPKPLESDKPADAVKPIPASAAADPSAAPKVPKSGA